MPGAKTGRNGGQIHAHGRLLQGPHRPDDLPLAPPWPVLARRMPWESLEKALAPTFAHRDRKGRSVPGHDLFGPTLEVAGAGVSPAGRPRLAIRLMVSLLYLKHAFDLSDEALVERWSENVLWQYFVGPEQPASPPDSQCLSPGTPLQKLQDFAIIGARFLAISPGSSWVQSHHNHRLASCSGIRCAIT